MQDLLKFMRSFNIKESSLPATQGQLLDAMKLIVFSICPEKMVKAIDDLDEEIPEKKEITWTD